MNKYELTLVLDGKAGATTKKKVIETLEKVLVIFKGAIKESKDWGVKDLAYPIRSANSKIGKSETGLYLFFELELDPTRVKAFNDKLRTDADIIRFLLINKDK
jgi:ribosomal protein S6